MLINCYNKWEKMGVLGFKASKEVPSELPDLISDEIERESLSEVADSPKEEQIYSANNNISRNTSLRPMKKKIEDYRAGAQESQIILEGINEDLDKEDTPIKNETTTIVQNNPPVQNEKTPSENIRAIGHNDEKSFFNDLQENLEKEIAGVDSLEKWNESKFSSRDMLGDMRSYWEKQKTPSIMEALGKSFQSKISQKVQTLQNLEKEWQGTYFELIGKEEEIKDAEQELKSMLNEFVKICKNKKDSLENGNTKTKEENKENEQKNIQEEITTN
jgi:hypothetical protein